MMSPQLDKEEQELLDAYEAGEFRSDMSPSRKKILEQAAVTTFQQEKEINVRIPERDFSALQRKALEAGIPYQTLVVSVLHKFASGSLYDATANKANPVDARTSRD
jgi:predicted DNA binding CopG/RHH family protein